MTPGINMHELHFKRYVIKYSILFVNYGTLCYAILSEKTKHAKQNTHY